VTLEQASLQALEAARSGDLEALDTALAARADALRRGEPVSPGVYSAGELTASLLRNLVRDIAGEAARLRQVEVTVATPPVAHHVDLSA
jgi:hypothetical protein